jgi:hypothetical protein
MEPLLSVHSHSLILKILAGKAGRVRSLEFMGTDLLSGPEVNPDNWGATYWTSPQSDWGWPPVQAIDGAPYEVLVAGDVVSLRSPLAEFGGRSLVIEKHFRPGPHPCTIDTEYVIENRGTTSFRMASWEISRVWPGGLTFFPTGESEISPVAPHSFMPTEKAFGTTFYDHALFEKGQSLKLHADGKLGYLAHVTGNVLLLKLFADTAPEQQAPGEGECELYANLDGSYVEIEVQSEYAFVEPGARSSFVVRTSACELPPGLGREQREGLRAFADERARALG